MLAVDCTATGLHSFMQATGGIGITVDNVTIENTTIDAYIPVAIRNATTDAEYKLNLKGDNEFNAPNRERVEIGVSKTKEEGEFVDVEKTDAKVSVEAIVDSVPSTPTEPAKPDNSPNTGDNSMAPFAIAGLALAAMAAVAVTRRRTN